MNDLIAGLFGLINSQALNIMQLLIAVTYCSFIKKLSISSQGTAYLGFFLLFLVMLCNLFSWDQTAGFLASYVLIFFIIAAAQQLWEHLQLENSKKAEQNEF